MGPIRQLTLGAALVLTIAACSEASDLGDATTTTSAPPVVVTTTATTTSLAQTTTSSVTTTADGTRTLNVTLDTDSDGVSTCFRIDNDGGLELVYGTATAYLRRMFEGANDRTTLGEPLIYSNPSGCTFTFAFSQAPTNQPFYQIDIEGYPRSWTLTPSDLDAAKWNITLDGT
jgi:hypothetical protein